MKKVVLFLWLFLNTTNWLNSQSSRYSIKGILLHENGQSAAGVELTLAETGQTQTTDINGRFQFNLLGSYDDYANLSLRVNSDAPYTFSPNNSDSVFYLIKPEKRKDFIKLRIYDKAVLYMHSEVPENFNDLYNSEYTIFLFTSSERLDEKEAWKLKNQLNSNYRIEVHSHYDLDKKNLYRYTIGRFGKLSQAEAFLDSVKNIGLDRFKKKPPYIVNLLLTKPPQIFYRIQVCSADKSMNKYEKTKIESKIQRTIIEIKDNNVNVDKYDYFVDIKLKEKKEAQKICSEIRTKGIKGAYVVRYEVKENKIVKTKSLKSNTPVGKIASKKFKRG